MTYNLDPEYYKQSKEFDYAWSLFQIVVNYTDYALKNYDPAYLNPYIANLPWIEGHLYTLTFIYEKNSFSFTTELLGPGRKWHLSVFDDRKDDSFTMTGYCPKILN
jgi:hypothetical protein